MPSILAMRVLSSQPINAPRLIKYGFFTAAGSKLLLPFLWTAVQAAKQQGAATRHAI